jgi:hypothetical protein
MKKITNLLLLLTLLVFPITTNAQKDAFVLVDVSGTMRYSQINQEAKQIISGMLQGNLSLSNFQGWSQVQGINGNCPFLSSPNTTFLSNGGKICLIPFGNMDRVKDYTFIDKTNFQSSFETLFPTSFNDSWTYITLAKAYAVHVAAQNNMSGMVYMIIYSDGAEESMNGSVGYKPEYRDIVDYFGTQNDSFCQKKGIIRKSYQGKDFDIEIWTMGPIVLSPSQCNKCGKQPCACDDTPIVIKNPKEGKSPKDPIEIKTKTPLKLQWANANGNVSIDVKLKVGEKFKSINRGERENHYLLEKKSNSNKADIIFYEKGDYEIVIGDSQSNDKRYLNVKSNPLAIILPFLICVVLIVGAVLVWRAVGSKPQKGDLDINPNFPNNDGNTEDW